jgi:hypothetical protein
VFIGHARAFLIGPESERWDAAMLVRQRDAQSFLAFASDPACMAGIGHRVAALEDSRLLPVDRRFLRHPLHATPPHRCNSAARRIPRVRHPHRPAGAADRHAPPSLLFRGHRDMTALVSLRDIVKTYQRGPETVQVLHGIDLDIDAATSSR